jgi:hypothetical protein
MPLIPACMLGVIASQLPSVEGGLHDFKSVHIVFVEEHSSDFASGFGHLFVCLPERPIEEFEDLLGATALNFGADISPLGKGVWIGEYKLQATHALVRQNAFFEQRRMTVFELTIPENKLAPLKTDLVDRLSKEYPYDFIRHNCGHYIWDWLNGPNEDPVAAFYLTPREALGRILEEYPPLHIRTVLSDVEILEDYIAQNSGADSTVIRDALVDVNAIAKIENLGTRLLAIKVAESRANKDEFAFLQKLRAETLSKDGGAEAATDIIEWQSGLSAQNDASWPKEGERPSVSATAIGSPDDGSHGFRFSVEAGLRDSFTEPVPSNVLREIHFLKGTIEERKDSLDIEFILISLATLRDAGGLLGGPSSGISAGYTGLQNPLGVSGLFATTWGGLAIRTDSGWLGGRLSLTADELDSQVDFSAAAGLTWDVVLPDHSLHAEIHYGEGGLGGLIRHDALLSRSLSLRTELNYFSGGESLASIGLQFRF